MHESLAKKAFVELLKCSISLLSESHLSLSRYVDINQIAKVTKLIEIWVLVILDNSVMFALERGQISTL